MIFIQKHERKSEPLYLGRRLILGLSSSHLSVKCCAHCPASSVDIAGPLSFFKIEPSKLPCRGSTRINGGFMGQPETMCTLCSCVCKVDILHDRGHPLLEHQKHDVLEMWFYLEERFSDFGCQNIFIFEVKYLKLSKLWTFLSTFHNILRHFLTCQEYFGSR